MNIQPLITSAFATYTVSRSNYGMRLDDTQAISSGDENAAQGVSPSDATQSDRDAGKPRSASGDVLDLSQEARDIADAKAELNGRIDAAVGNKVEIGKSDASSDTISMDAPTTEAGEPLETGAAVELTPEEQEQVEELKVRDAEVRIHEQAHVSAGGAYVTGGPSYTYQTGPDGNKYAIGGEVGIDTGEISGDPEATIRKMQTVAQAALAPAEPSGQDYKVAAAARQKEAKARAELSSMSSETLASETASQDASDVESESSSISSSDSAVPASEQNTGAESRISVAKQSASSSSVSRQSSAYQAQSTMPLNTAANRISQFSAFA